MLEYAARDTSFRDYRTIVLLDLCGAIGGTFAGSTTREDVTVCAEEMDRASLWKIAFSVADVATREEVMKGRCQTKSKQPPKFLTARLLGGQLPPLGQCRGAVLLEDFAAVEMAFQIEVVVDRGVDGDEHLQSLHVLEFGHRSLSSPEWLV